MYYQLLTSNFNKLLFTCQVAIFKHQIYNTKVGECQLKYLCIAKIWLEKMWITQYCIVWTARFTLLNREFSINLTIFKILNIKRQNSDIFFPNKTPTSPKKLANISKFGINICTTEAMRTRWAQLRESLGRNNLLLSWIFSYSWLVSNVQRKCIPL